MDKNEIINNTIEYFMGDRIRLVNSIIELDPHSPQYLDQKIALEVQISNLDLQVQSLIDKSLMET